METRVSHLKTQKKSLICINVHEYAHVRLEGAGSEPELGEDKLATPMHDSKTAEHDLNIGRKDLK